MSSYGKPDWLKNNADETPSKKDWLSAPPGPASDTGEPKLTASPSQRGRCFFLFAISATLLAAFIYSVTKQNDDDPDKIEWYIFFAVNASIPALFLCHYFVCFPAKIIYAISAVVTVWSIVYIVLYSLKLDDTPAGDEDTKDLRDEYIWELVEVSLGLFSALYHVFVMNCCVNKNSSKE
jgi:hypothetical protein